MVSNHSVARGSYYRRLCVCLPALNDTLSRYKGPDVSETRPHRGQHPSAAWPCVCLGWRHRRQRQQLSGLLGELREYSEVIQHFP